MKSTKNYSLLIILFLASITFPLVFSDKTGGKVSVTEKRYLATFPTILTKDKKLAPGLKTGLEKWLDDNIGFRTQVKQLQIDFDFNVFHVSPSNKVVIGKDGWYYYTDENNIAIGLGTYPISDDLLRRIRKNQEAVQAELKSKGIEYVIALIPSKVSIYPEYIGGGSNARDTLIDVVSDYLFNNTTIPVINTKPDLLEAKKSGLVYFKTDTHWNDSGTYTGYRSIIKSLNELGMIHSTPVAISTKLGTHTGDLISLMGVADFLPPESFDAIQVISPRAARIESGTFFSDLNALTKSYNLDPMIYLSQNEKTEIKKIVILGDSFFAASKIPDLLAENFSTLILIRSHEIRSNVIELVKPDVVMVEITERNISQLMDYPIPNEISAK